MKKEIKNCVHLLHEAGLLAKLPRSGFAFLGTGQQSVAEHSHRMTLTAYLLASLMKKPVNLQKLLLMCLIHDLPEARMGDLNYVNKLYVEANEDKVLDEYEKFYPCGQEFRALIQEYNESQTLEAQLAHDADQLEMLLVLKQLSEAGNSHAMKWFDKTEERLQIKEAKEVAAEIRTQSSDAWWLYNPEDPHWIHGGKRKKEKKAN